MQFKEQPSLKIHEYKFVKMQLVFTKLLSCDLDLLNICDTKLQHAGGHSMTHIIAVSDVLLKEILSRLTDLCPTPQAALVTKKKESITLSLLQKRTAISTEPHQVEVIRVEENVSCIGGGRNTQEC